MNGKEAIEAMLAGKTIKHFDGTRWRFENGFRRLNTENDVWESRGFFGTETYELHKEPNPHPKGTFAWAYEETKRGRTTKRPMCYLTRDTDLVGVEHALATDWELA